MFVKIVIDIYVQKQIRLNFGEPF